MPSHTPQEIQLKLAIDNKQLDTRSALGVAFGRAHPKGSEAGAKYRECKTWEEKQNFRFDWAGDKFETSVQSRIHLKKWQKIDTTKGTYMPFRKVHENEGLDEDGLRAAVLLCMKCIRMGGKWIRFNEFTERLEFLILLHGFVENMEESWAMYQNESTPGPEEL